MRLIYLCGPPAVGKRTTATELSRHTGIRLFHNHLTVAVVIAVFPDEDPRRTGLLKELRLHVIDAAAEAGQDLIFTTVYSGRSDDDFIDQVVHTVERHGGVVHFVQLSAPLATLMERVTSESRRPYPKLETPDQLKEFIAAPHRDVFAVLPRSDVLHIDTSVSQVNETVEKIVQKLDL